MLFPSPSHTMNSAGVYSEHVSCGLDWLVAECFKRRLRLLLVLTNYWLDYGGMQQYVRYAADFQSTHHNGSWLAARKV